MKNQAANQQALKLLATELRRQCERVNLFSRGDREKLEEKHFPDALEILNFWDLKDGARVLDLGTGGGVPGLVLAVVCPDKKFVLLDSTEKKLMALDRAIESLNILNAETLWGRAEELSKNPECRGRFDAVLVRAVADLKTLVGYGAGFLKSGGSLYAWKGPSFEEELLASREAQKKFGLHFDASHSYSLSAGESRVLLRFVKN